MERHGPVLLRAGRLPAGARSKLGGSGPRDWSDAPSPLLLSRPETRLPKHQIFSYSYVPAETCDPAFCFILFGALYVYQCTYDSKHRSWLHVGNNGSVLCPGARATCSNPWKLSRDFYFPVLHDDVDMSQLGLGLPETLVFWGCLRVAAMEAAGCRAFADGSRIRLTAARLCRAS